MTGMEGPLTLLEGLGSPQPQVLVPGRRHPLWHHAALTLRHHLRRAGLGGSFRSWQCLWRVLADTPPPAQVLWDQLCHGFAWGAFLTVLRTQHNDGGPEYTVWNARWLLDPRTGSAAAKRAVILRSLLRNAVTLIQATHWNAAAIAKWRGAFLAATVIASPSTQDPDGRPAGGVAIILPPGWVLVDQD